MMEKHPRRGAGERAARILWEGGLARHLDKKAGGMREMARRLACFAVALLLLGGLALTVWAGMGGKLSCARCGWASNSLHVGRGMVSFCTVIYCGKCKDFSSILTGFDENRARDTAELQRNVVRPIGEVYSYELDKPIKLYPCPKCQSACAEIGEGLILQANGASALRCPRCGQKSLTFTRTMMWD